MVDHDWVEHELESLRLLLWSAIEDRSLASKRIDDLEDLAGRLGAISVPALANENLRPIFLRCGSILIETSELFGHSEVAGSVTGLGQAIFQHIQDASRGRGRGRRRFVLREEIRFVVNVAYNSVHRQGEPEDALAAIDRCVQVLERDLVSTEMPCFATRGHAHFHRALVGRHVGREHQAGSDLQHALEFFASKARIERAAGVTKEGPYPRWLVLRAVDVLTEMGFAAYSQGALSRAVECASSAELAQVREGTEAAADAISSTYVTLLRSAVQRSLIGPSDPQRLQEVLRDLEQVEAAYARFGHKRGQMRARYEQAQTYIYLGDTEAARQTLEAVRELASTDPDQRWICHVDTQVSKLATSLDDAIACASRALEHADRFNLRTTQIDALLARADARLKWGSDTARARDDLHRVLGYEAVKTGSTPRLRVKCLLLMAQSYVRDGNSAEADGYLRGARKLLETVEHAGLKDLLRRVESDREALETAHDFRIRREGVLTYPEHQRQLQRWLLAEVQRTHKTDRGAAAALGISRMTFYKWRDEFRGSATDRRRSKKRRTR